MTSRPARTGRLTRWLTWLAVAAGILRSRRFQDRVIVQAIVLAGLAGLGREMWAHSFTHVRTWVRKIDQRSQRTIARVDRRAQRAIARAKR